MQRNKNKTGTNPLNALHTGAAAILKHYRITKHCPGRNRIEVLKGLTIIKIWAVIEIALQFKCIVKISEGE